jgi:hypothetical protein
MTVPEAVEFLWSAKSAGQLVDGKFVGNPNWCSAFLYATTKKSVKFRTWNGTHPVEKNEAVEEKPAGTRVLVTMMSRFGHVGIRARDLVPASNGYDACVQPEELEAWSKEP